MTGVAKASPTTNNATVFPMVTDAAVRSVDASCTGDGCFYREAARTLSRQELCGTNVDSTAVG